MQNPKKIIRIAGIIVSIFIFALIISKIYKKIAEDGKAPFAPTPTPTIAPFQPYRPSVYSEDPEVLEIEESVKILDRELSTVILEEAILHPPVVNYNINFK